MAASIDGLALGALAAGALFAYSGVKGWSIPHAIQALVQGQAPSGKANPIGGTPATPSGILSGAGLGASTPSGAYDHAGLMKLWTQNGGDPAAANNAACHAIQESSGNASVTSPNPDGGTNVGLWQLDTKGKGAGYTVAQLQNPDTNARVTIMGTSNGRDWSAWATPGC
jgi:hypothetical protein